MLLTLDCQSQSVAEHAIKAGVFHSPVHEKIMSVLGKFPVKRGLLRLRMKLPEHFCSDFDSRGEAYQRASDRSVLNRLLGDPPWCVSRRLSSVCAGGRWELAQPAAIIDSDNTIPTAHCLKNSHWFLISTKRVTVALGNDYSLTCSSEMEAASAQASARDSP